MTISYTLSLAVGFFVIGFIVHLGTYFFIGESSDNKPAASLIAGIVGVAVLKLSWWLAVVPVIGHFCSVLLCHRFGKLRKSSPNQKKRWRG